MRYVVVETYSSGPEPVYRRAAERGRMLPDGRRPVDTPSFEIHPVIGSAEAAARVGMPAAPEPT